MLGSANLKRLLSVLQRLLSYLVTLGNLKGFGGEFLLV